MIDINEIAKAAAGGRSLEELKASAQRAVERKREAVGQLSEHGKDYLANIWNANKVDNAKGVISYEQEGDYEHTRKAFWERILIRGEEIAKLKNIANYPIVFTQEQGEVIKDLLKWLINDNTSSLPLNKGIWLHGEVGTFKTELMQIMAKFSQDHNLSKKFHFVDWSISYEDFITDAKTYESLIRLNRCFDEFLKKTNDVKDFGNAENPNETLIEVRYKKFQAYGQKTIIISNFSPNYALNVLSTQAGDRMKSMFGSIEMPGTSKRN
jgi:hypothetical protein